MKKPVPKMRYKDVSFWRNFFSTPFIYSGLIIFPLTHIFIELYHTVCFYLYKLPYVDRSKYIKIDRHKLYKLSYLQKLNCIYCGYVNGLLAYMVEIVAQTELYWCSIKHEQDGHFIEPKHHKYFYDREDFT